MEKNSITGLGPAETTEPVNVENAIKNFEANGFTVKHFATGAEAAAYLDKAIDGTTVGFGDSHTLIDMHVADMLAKHNYIVDPNACPDNVFIPVVEKALNTEVFLTSVNGASETGEMVNIDSTGNRVAGSLFGHKKVYYVFSVNKLMPTLEKAIWRARNIAAPINAKRFGFKTPCAVRGDRCYNCKSPDRICNKLVIYMKQGKRMEEEIILIDEPMGY